MAEIPAYSINIGGPLPVDGEAGRDLAGTDASFELLEEFVVAGGQRRLFA